MPRWAVAKIRDVQAVHDREGVAGVQSIVTRRMKRWIFREQPTDDYGIDAQLEIVDGEVVTGKLIGLQIKSGVSYFSKQAEGGWWFYLDLDDLDYWLKHSLPVLVVLYDESRDQAFWQYVDEKVLVATKQRKGKPAGRKLLIPEAQILGPDSMLKLAEVAAGDAYELRIRRLRLALPWMNLLRTGRRILLEADEWVNKTSGRGDLSVVSVDDANEDRQALGKWTVLAGYRRYEDVLPQLVPWAYVTVHEETYDEADREAYEAEEGRYDKEDDTVYYAQSFEDWHEFRRQDGLRPYGNSAGEVDQWRLELKLNQLGEAFLLVDEFAEGDTPLLAPEVS